MDLFRQLCVLPHRDRSCNLNLLSHHITAYWHRASQSWQGSHCSSSMSILEWLDQETALRGSGVWSRVWRFPGGHLTTSPPRREQENTAQPAFSSNMSKLYDECVVDMVHGFTASILTISTWRITECHKTSSSRNSSPQSTWNKFTPKFIPFCLNEFIPKIYGYLSRSVVLNAQLLTKSLWSSSRPHKQITEDTVHNVSQQRGNTYCSSQCCYGSQWQQWCSSAHNCCTLSARSVLGTDPQGRPHTCWWCHLGTHRQDTQLQARRL